MNFFWEEKLFACRRCPGPWRTLCCGTHRTGASYYHGDDAQQGFSRIYSYSDRCRYYWPVPEVQEEVSRLLSNLENQALPATLISQFLPLEYEAVRSLHRSRPRELICLHIQAILRRHAMAREAN